MPTQKIKTIDIHQLLVDQQKLNAIKAYYEFLREMSHQVHCPQNRKDYWSGAINTIKTLIEILDIGDHLF